MAENIPPFDRRRWGPGGIELVAGFIVAGLAVLIYGVAAGRASLEIIGTIYLVGGIALFVAKVAEQIQPVTIKWELIGEPGEAVTEVGKNAKGVVRVRSELWSAKSTSPIAAGSQVRVTKVEGLQVWVEKPSANSNAD
jgi:membrane-bound ClpP family serine protease